MLQEKVPSLYGKTMDKYFSNKGNGAILNTNVLVLIALSVTTNVVINAGAVDVMIRTTDFWRFFARFGVVITLSE